MKDNKPGRGRMFFKEKTFLRTGKWNIDLKVIE